MLYNANCRDTPYSRTHFPSLWPYKIRTAHFSARQHPICGCQRSPPLGPILGPSTARSPDALYSPPMTHMTNRRAIHRLYGLSITRTIWHLHCIYALLPYTLIICIQQPLFNKGHTLLNIHYLGYYFYLCVSHILRPSYTNTNNSKVSSFKEAIQLDDFSFFLLIVFYIIVYSL